MTNENERTNNFRIDRSIMIKINKFNVWERWKPRKLFRSQRMFGTFVAIKIFC